MDDPIRINPIDFQQDVAVGLKLPLVSSRGKFFALNYTTWEQLRTNLKNLLLTEKGERIMLPDYGAGLRRFIFEPNTLNNQVYIEEYITQAVAKWLPQIRILDINVNTNDRNPNQIDINIKFQSRLDETNVDILNISFMTTR